jgi:uncharacterized membrane protein
MKADAGSASLLTILLLPVIVLVLASVLDLGLLRLAAARARAAVDLAAIVAVNDQTEPVPGGALSLAADAEDVAREYLALNLAGMTSLLAADAHSIASGADVAAFATGGTDPRDGSRYDRPTVRIDAVVPLRGGTLRSLLGPVTVRAYAVAAAR